VTSLEAATTTLVRTKAVFSLMYCQAPKKVQSYLFPFHVPFIPAIGFLLLPDWPIRRFICQVT
jgi:hypothetical protein